MSARQRLSSLVFVTAIAGLLFAAPACEDDPVTPTGDVATGDVDLDATDGGGDGTTNWEGKSYYRITIADEFGEPFTLERDLTGNNDVFAYGDTHIAPALSFAVKDAVTFPGFVEVTFNFGIVQGSQTYPVQCDAAGSYGFGGAPPEIEILKTITYKSSVVGSTGSIEISDWSKTTGGLFRGTFSGRIRQDTDNVEKRYADIEGEFQFYLPEKNSGQPQ